MVDALSDRPRPGRRPPRELFLGERRDERVGLCGQALELLPELVDLGRQRKMTGGSHDIIVAAGPAYNPRRSQNHDVHASRVSEVCRHDCGGSGHAHRCRLLGRGRDVLRARVAQSRRRDSPRIIRVPSAVRSRRSPSCPCLPANGSVRTKSSVCSEPAAWERSYRARDTRLQRDVAIKVIPASLVDDPVARARFDAESRAVAALSHPNIIAIFDAGSESGTFFAVTELLDGKTLRDVLKDGPLPPRRAIDVAVQVAAGLAAAHAQGITHRDLKPENIFVTRDGRVKVLDFGLAKVIAPAAEGATVAATFNPTSPGMVLGTVGYMSPEQVRALPVDHRSDIFSLGAVLYEMLTGVRAFTGASAVETMNAILKEDPPELTRSNAALPPALDRIVHRCLEKEPGQRFESARDLGFALEGISTSSATVPASVATAAAPARSRRLMTAALVVAAAVIGVVAGRSSVPAMSPPTVTFGTKTFDPMTVFNGRFGPDGETIVFSAAVTNRASELYVIRPDAVTPQRFGPANTHLLSVSSTGELAVLTDATFISHRLFSGTLARMRLDGTPRPWLENVREADWSPDGSTLAIVRDLGQKDQLEYPIGKVLHTADGYLSDVRVSPDGERVAFFEHPIRYDDRGWLKVVDKTGMVKTLTPEYGEQKASHGPGTGRASSMPPVTGAGIPFTRVWRAWMGRPRRTSRCPALACFSSTYRQRAPGLSSATTMFGAPGC